MYFFFLKNIQNVWSQIEDEEIQLMYVAWQVFLSSFEHGLLNTKNQLLLLFPLSVASFSSAALTS